MSGNKYIITQGVTTSMEKNRIRPIPTGKSMRMSYQRQKEVLEMPNLIEVQKDSYDWFLRSGLKEVFDDISPISDYGGRLSLEFVDFTLCEDDVKYSIEECKQRDATYAAPLKVKVRLYNKEKDEITEHEIFMGDLPLMTATGTFVINGAERVIVSQLVRSPGIYYGIAHDEALCIFYCERLARTNFLVQLEKTFLIVGGSIFGEACKNLRLFTEQLYDLCIGAYSKCTDEDCNRNFSGTFPWYLLRHRT